MELSVQLATNDKKYRRNDKSRFRKTNFIHKLNNQKKGEEVEEMKPAKKRFHIMGEEFMKLQTEIELLKTKKREFRP